MDTSSSFSHEISPEQLLLDLYHAYKSARKHKRGRHYQLLFEKHLESNLISLRDDLYSHKYTPRPSTCFMVHDPKMREVFAADFRDRIVHHLFYNYTYDIFFPTFIADSYSCIKGRGTHYGVERLKHHILSESHNYQRECFVLKLDISGYFMHINRTRLLGLCRKTLARRRPKYPDFVDYLLETIVRTDPVRDCIMLGEPADWERLPDSKSLLCAAPDCGLPIGNLSSQLFSNIYLNVFDQYCKRTLKAHHYGRYVDDAYIVSRDRQWLKSLIPQMRTFLKEELNLMLNEKKVQVVDVRYGVAFLGTFMKPYRTYICHSSLKRMCRKVRYVVTHYEGMELQSRINSHLGVLSHLKSYNFRLLFFSHEMPLCKMGQFRHHVLRYYPYSR